jgi:hypothetical protein
MTCRTAWAGEQLHDVEAGDAGGGSLSRARRGYVAAPLESTPCLGELGRPRAFRRFSPNHFPLRTHPPSHLCSTYAH